LLAGIGTAVGYKEQKHQIVSIGSSKSGTLKTKQSTKQKKEKAGHTA
jgi:hypothetical protein